MAIKMRVLKSSGKKKISTIADAIKAKYDLSINSVDVIPPAYSCDKERVVILIISAKGDVGDTVRRFCGELTKVRAANVALMIDGNEAAANQVKEVVANAGANVIEEVLYIKGGLPFLGGVKPEEMDTIYAWVDRVVANLK